MKTLKKVYYHQIEKIKDILKVDSLFCIPIFQEWLSDKEINKIKMDNFLSVGKRNFDWYFSENNWNKYLEEIKNVYFSKKILDNNNFEYLDFFDELDLYLFTVKNV